MNWTCPECGARKEDFEMVEILMFNVQYLVFNGLKVFIKH